MMRADLEELNDALCFPAFVLRQPTFFEPDAILLFSIADVVLLLSHVVFHDHVAAEILPLLGFP